MSLSWWTILRFRPPPPPENNNQVGVDLGLTISFVKIKRLWLRTCT